MQLLAPTIPPTVGGIRPEGYDCVVLQLWEVWKVELRFKA